MKPLKHSKMYQVRTSTFKHIPPIRGTNHKALSLPIQIKTMQNLVKDPHGFKISKNMNKSISPLLQESIIFLGVPIFQSPKKNFHCKDF